MTFFDRIKETSTSTGTSTFTLAGAVIGYKTFTNGTYKYCIVNNTETEWEVGEGIVASGVLTRTTIEASSNAGSAVNFSAGTKYVFNTVSAAYVNSLVPYTGATASVNLGEYGLTAGQLTLDTSPTGTAVVGTTQWNDTIGSSQTLLKGGNVLLKNGVDLVARVVNKVSPATTLTKAAYKAVRVSGAQGQRLAIAYAQANNDNNSADTIGLVCETIAANQEGFIITVGQLLDVNTTGSLQGETWADGDVLYLSPTTAGNLTNIKPNGSTGHIVIIGYVEYAHANNGKIYVKVMNGWELDELHNCYINAPANNEVLTYESSTDLWKNKSIATALGYTPANDSLVMHLAGTETATGVKTFSIGLATTTGDNFMNTSSGNTYVGYSAVAASPLKFNVKDAIRVEYTANRFVDIKVNPSLSDYAYIQASNTTGFSIVSSGTLFLRPSDSVNTIYFGSYVIQKDITASALYGSSSVTGRGFEMSTNVPFVVKSSIDSGGGTIGAFTFHGTDSANFLHRVTGSTAAIHTIKTTGQLQLHNYTTTTSFTGTVAGLLGFDSSGNIITTSASGGISGSGTAGQVTYWSGTTGITGSSNFTWDGNNIVLGNSKGITLSNAGSNRSTNIYPLSTLDNLANLNFYPSSGTNVAQSFQVIPKGTGITGLRAQFTIFNTDYINDTTNYEALVLRSTGTSFTLASGKAGTGTIRPILLSSGFLDGSTNANQFWLYTSGNIGINTTSDSNYRLDINGTGATAGALRVTGGGSYFNGTLDIIGASSYLKLTYNGSNNAYITAANDGAISFKINSNIKFYVGASSISGIEIPNTYSIAFVNPGVSTHSNINWNTTTNAFEFKDGTKSNFVKISSSDISCSGILTVTTNKTTLAACTTSYASLNIPSGTAPTSPVNGDIWFDGTNIYIRVGGSTKTFTII